VLERSKIAAEMKDLDQPSRASLRKYGVRFGAYHIYTPALLKPAARALASLLWAEKQSNVDMSALSNAQHLAGSGRTSFPVDKLLDRDAYRVLGYRQCGERAVRVDILERLADLIRPALSWRETSPGAKPPGAFDGRGFVVTQAMTSLTGSAGEDFASILRALGYRMEKKPALPPKPVVVEAPAAEAAAAETAAVEALPVDATSPEILSPVVAEAEVEGPAADSVAPEPVAAVESADDAPPVSEEVVAPSATLLPDISFAPATDVSEPIPVEAQPEPAAVAEVQAEAPPEQAAVEAAPETVADAAPAEASDAVPAETSDAAPTETSAAEAAPDAAAVPDMVDVWRPGGRSEERRPRHDRNRPRHQGHQQRNAEGAQPVAAVAGEAGEAAKGERHRRGRRDRNNEFRKPRTDVPAEANAAPAEGAPVREARDNKGRPPRERFEGKGRDDKSQGKPQDKPPGKFGGGRDKGGGGGRDKGGFGGKGGRDSGPSHRQWATSAAPRERDRPVDPNSPFAKLAALKEQLTAGRKDG
jgi:ATP-dependent RNA helicase SUPV3L1/SUV3